MIIYLLCRFIFSGDGRPVSSSPPLSSGRQQPPMEQQAQYCYDRTTMLSRHSAASSISSGSSSFGVQSTTPPSLPPKPKSNGVYEDTYEYAYATSTGPSNPQSISRSVSHSGPSSTQHLSSTPPPPINLSTHPSRRKHQRCLSNPADMVPQPSLGKQKSSSKDSGFNTESFEALNFDEDFQNINESMSNLISELSSEAGSIGKQDQQTFPSDLDDVISMLQDLGTEEVDATTSEVSPRVRTHSLPSGSTKTKHKRANSTSTCQPTHYIKHRLQKTPQPLPEQQEEYVFMQPVHKAPEPVKSVPPSCRQNYDQLTTIEERSLREEGPVSDYENYPLPADVAKATPIVFQPTYENFASTMTPDTTPSVTKHDDPLPDTLQTDPAPPVSSKSCDMTAFWDEIQNLENVLAGLTTQD